ncbi:MAG: hypothetical protein KTR24_15460 [Saprospiraceae bacterium]|nr:hypothetical protein [Saprospiraceae bacterium]
MQKSAQFVALVLMMAVIGCKTHDLKEPESKDLSSYMQVRKSWKDADAARSSAAAVVLTEAEQKVDGQLRKMRLEMLSHYKSTHFFPPARNFYQSKKHIEETALFGFLQRMPKGGILHLHMSAMGDADWMVNRAMQTPEMHVYWRHHNGEHIKGEMRAFERGKAPTGFFPVQELASDVVSFKDSLRALLVFDEHIDRDSVDIWTEFERVFQRITGFVTYRPIWSDYLYEGLLILAKDNIQHAELRLPFLNTLYDLDAPANPYALADFVQTFVEVQQRIRKIDPGFTMNIIHANLRFFDQQTIWNDITFTHQNRTKYPQWLKGYDLVAEEDAGHPTLFHVENFLRLDSLETATGVSLPLYLHDGESDWVSVDNLYDAILLGTRRIGHGFNLFRFPGLMERVREEQICMEINPLSNQILGYVRDLRIHPASIFWGSGIPLTISSDDPLIFDYHGLSYDFWSIFLAWELGLADLKALCQNSLVHSAMTPEEKKKALAVWDKRWNEFIKKEQF